jgi:undecaprenyl-diphosphatase
MMTKARKWLIGAIILAAAALLVWLSLAGRPESKIPDVFSPGNITVVPGQTVGKLLVADGDAVIAGRVTGWLAVIGGSVTLQTGGRIDGPLLVLGGNFLAQPRPAHTPPIVFIMSAGSPFIAPLAWTLIIGAAVVPLTVALLLWLLTARMRGRPFSAAYLTYCTPTGNDGLASMPSRPRRKRLLLALFVHLTQETIFHHETDLVDRAVIWLVRQLATPAADNAMIVVTALGAGALAAFAPVVLGGLLWLGLRREAVSLAVCLAGAGLLNFLLKNLFERARPDMFEVINVTGYSFPSGHAMVSLWFYGMLAYLLCCRMSRLPCRCHILPHGGARDAIGFCASTWAFTTPATYWVATSPAGPGCCSASPSCGGGK